MPGAVSVSAPPGDALARGEGGRASLKVVPECRHSIAASAEPMARGLLELAESLPHDLDLLVVDGEHGGDCAGGGAAVHQ